MTTYIKKIKTRHIVVGVDVNYLHKAIIFYNSLSKFHNNFILHIFCFDDVAYKVIKILDHKNIIALNILMLKTGYATRQKI